MTFLTHHPIQSCILVISIGLMLLGFFPEAG